MRIGGVAARPGLYRCRERPECGQFTVTVGTIMERSHLALRYWIMAFWLLAETGECPEAPALRERAGMKSGTSARYSAQRVRLAMVREPLSSELPGILEGRRGGHLSVPAATEALLRAAMRIPLTAREYGAGQAPGLNKTQPDLQ